MRRRSAVLGSSVEAAWATLRQPLVGDVQTLPGPRGGAVVCWRLAASDRDRTLTACVLEAPLPFAEWVVTTTLLPVTDGTRALWLRQSRLRTDDQWAAELAALDDALADAELAALREGPVPSAVSARTAPHTGTTTAGAIIVTSFGGPDVLAWAERQVPPPGPGEVQLRHTAIGVNFIDVYARSGVSRLLEPGGVPGMEAAGVVEVVGPEVSGMTPGDRVAYACAPAGAYATRRTMPAELVVPLPEAIDEVAAAAVLLKGLTAEFLLHRVHRLRPGQTVLVHAAAGGTGLLLCQWAAAIGATVIGSVSTEAKARLAATHGCAYPLVLGVEELPAAVRRLTGGRGVDVVYDGVGGPGLIDSIAALAVRGHLVSFGQAGGPIPPVDVGALAAKSAMISRPNFSHWVGSRVEAVAGADRLFAALADGRLRPAPPRRLPLRDAATAHLDLEARRTTGATVLIP